MAIDGMSIVTKGAVVVRIDIFWNCSMTSRRVEVTPKENPCMAVMQITSAMQRYEDDRRGNIIEVGLIMVDIDIGHEHELWWPSSRRSGLSRQNQSFPVAKHASRQISASVSSTMVSLAVGAAMTMTLPLVLLVPMRRTS